MLPEIIIEQSFFLRKRDGKKFTTIIYAKLLATPVRKVLASTI